MPRTTHRLIVVPALLLSIAAAVFALAACERSSPSSSAGDDDASRVGDLSGGGGRIELVNRVVEAACGECQFGMKGPGCDLAVRIDGETYFVDGVNLDDLGDAHAADGMCNAVRPARVTGRIEDGRFAAQTLELVDDESAEEEDDHG